LVVAGGVEGFEADVIDQATIVPARDDLLPPG
jgi:hypothetical protein